MQNNTTSLVNSSETAAVGNQAPITVSLTKPGISPEVPASILTTVSGLDGEDIRTWLVSSTRTRLNPALRASRLAAIDSSGLRLGYGSRGSLTGYHSRADDTGQTRTCPSLPRRVNPVGQGGRNWRSIEWVDFELDNVTSTAEFEKVKAALEAEKRGFEQGYYRFQRYDASGMLRACHRMCVQLTHRWLSWKLEVLSSLAYYDTRHLTCLRLRETSDPQELARHPSGLFAGYTGVWGEVIGSVRYIADGHDHPRGFASASGQNPIEWEEPPQFPHVRLYSGERSAELRECEYWDNEFLGIALPLGDNGQVINRPEPTNAARLAAEALRIHNASARNNAGQPRGPRLFGRFTGSDFAHLGRNVERVISGNVTPNEWITQTRISANLVGNFDPEFPEDEILQLPEQDVDLALVLREDIGTFSEWLGNSNARNVFVSRARTADEVLLDVGRFLSLHFATRSTDRILWVICPHVENKSFTQYVRRAGLRFKSNSVYHYRVWEHCLSVLTPAASSSLPGSEADILGLLRILAELRTTVSFSDCSEVDHITPLMGSSNRFDSEVTLTMSVGWSPWPVRLMAACGWFSNDDRVHIPMGDRLNSALCVYAVEIAKCFDRVMQYTLGSGWNLRALGIWGKRLHSFAVAAMNEVLTVGGPHGLLGIVIRSRKVLSNLEHIPGAWTEDMLRAHNANFTDWKNRAANPDDFIADSQEITRHCIFDQSLLGEIHIVERLPWVTYGFPMGHDEVWTDDRDYVEQPKQTRWGKWDLEPGESGARRLRNGILRSEVSDNSVYIPDSRSIGGRCRWRINAFSLTSLPDEPNARHSVYVTPVPLEMISALGDNAASGTSLIGLLTTQRADWVNGVISASSDVTTGDSHRYLPDF